MGKLEIIEQEITALRDEHEELKQRLSDVEEKADKTRSTLDDFMQVFVWLHSPWYPQAWCPQERSKESLFSY